MIEIFQPKKNFRTARTRTNTARCANQRPTTVSPCYLEKTSAKAIDGHAYVLRIGRGRGVGQFGSLETAVAAIPYSSSPLTTGVSVAPSRVSHVDLDEDITLGYVDRSPVVEAPVSRWIGGQSHTEVLVSNLGSSHDCEGLLLAVVSPHHSVTRSKCGLQISHQRLDTVRLNTTESFDELNRLIVTSRPDECDTNRPNVI
jgi:hypothetical protein